MKYGIRPGTVLKIVMPPEEFRAMGMKPFIKFPVFGEYTNVTTLRTWCNNNFKHSHLVGDHPLYDVDKRQLIGYDVNVYGEEEDLLLLQLAV